MAYRYRIIHVNAARTQELRRFNFNFVEANRNTCNNGAGANNLQSLEEIETRLKASNPGLTKIPSNILMICSTNEGVQKLRQLGFGNVWNMNIFSAGDRLYIDRWDANHSYIEISSISGQTMGLKYCCADGTVYIQTSFQIYSGGNADGGRSLPLCSSFDNWTQASQAGVQDLGVTGYGTGSLTGAGASMSMLNSGFTLAVAEKFWNTAKPLDGDNPYAEGGYTSLGGGDPDKQNWDDDSDTVVADAMPTKGAIASRLISVFTPTVAEMQNLASVLWGEDFFNWVNKIGSNIDDLFVSFGLVPFNVNQGATVNVKYYGFIDPISTISLTLCADQYYEMDMGSIDLANDSRIHTTDSIFDYSPFSKIGIYLPFIGYEELDIDEIRGCSIRLLYRIDVLSGSCLAIIRVYDGGDWIDLYQFSGNCMLQLPLTSVDASGMIQNSVSMATAMVGVASGSAVASAGAAAVEEAMTRKKNPLSEAQGEARLAGYHAQVSNANASLSAATANAAMGMKPSYKHSGAIGANTSPFAVKQPFLFLHTPREAVPEGYQKYCGLPSNITAKLGSCSGYTVVEDIRLNGLVATSPEVEEIYQLLKSGVII